MTVCWRRRLRHRAVPRIFYTFSSTEYWARAGSLTHTNEDGTADVPLASTSRLYFLAGHAACVRRAAALAATDRVTPLNFADQRWVLRALTHRSGQVGEQRRRAAAVPLPHPRETPARTARRPFAFHGSRRCRSRTTCPACGAWTMGRSTRQRRVITKEPPSLGDPYVVLVPQVNADGNDEGGIALPEVAVPLGTHTGWNVSTFPLSGLRYLAGLVGAFQPLARTRAEREQSGDSRLSIEERYSGRQDYLQRVRRAAADLVRAAIPVANRRRGRGRTGWAHVGHDRGPVAHRFS